MSKQKTTNTKTSTPAQQPDFLFDKSNYIMMLAGVLLVVIGFMLMTGGKSPDPNQFNAAEIYSTTRVTIAPLLILIGFAVEIYAIMKKPANQAS